MYIVTDYYTGDVVARSDDKLTAVGIASSYRYDAMVTNENGKTEFSTVESDNY